MENIRDLRSRREFVYRAMNDMAAYFEYQLSKADDAKRIEMITSETGVVQEIRKLKARLDRYDELLQN